MQLAAPGVHTHGVQSAVDETQVEDAAHEVVVEVSPSAAQVRVAVALAQVVWPGVHTHERQVPARQLCIAAQLAVV